jgi:hypothetical protein
LAAKNVAILRGPLWHLARIGEIDRIIPRPDLARNCENRLHPSRKFRSDDSERVALALNRRRGTALAVEGFRDRLLEGCFARKCRRYPDACGPGGIQDFDTRRHLKCAPTFDRSGLRKQGRSLREREAHRHPEPRLQKIATFHGQYPTYQSFRDFSASCEMSFDVILLLRAM